MPWLSNILFMSLPFKYRIFTEPLKRASGATRNKVGEVETKFETVASHHYHCRCLIVPECSVNSGYGRVA